MVTTTRLKPGYLRKNGIPYSANAVITEYFVRLVDDGQEYLAVTTMVDDPQYLALPYVKTYQYKKAARRVRMEPHAVRRALKAPASASAFRPLRALSAEAAFRLRPSALEA